MSVSWTEKQRETIETRGKNVLVSAAAGSGKTAVLTERILRLVTEDRVPLKELLVVTFTEAAAGEMKARIAAALTAVAEEDAFADAQLRQLGTARIMTFHAFCLTILRRYFYVIELDPSFVIADEKRALALREEAADEVFASAFADEDADFRASFTDFLLCYAEARDERKAREKVLKVYDFIVTLPDPFEWLENRVNALFVPSEEIAGIPAVTLANREIAHRLKYARFLTEQLGELLLFHGLKGLAAKNAADLEAVSQIERVFLSGDMEGTKTAFEELKFETFTTKKDEKEEYESIKALVSRRRDKVKAILREEIRDVFFARDPDEYAEEIAHIAPYLRTLETLVKRFSEAYARIKRVENVIDYADFEHMALRILEDESIADDYKRRFEYIFIDEYQDSNYVQEALISRISRRDNVFMVGDVKQSIYGFRNAVPEIFLKKYDEYPTEDKKDGAELRIDLSNNFRSKAGVIDAVNAVFRNVMESHYSGLGYDENVWLEKGVSYEAEYEGKTCLHLMTRDADKELFGSDAEGEAALCAKLILETVGKTFFDAKTGQGQLRTIGFGDIVILLSKVKSAADTYRKTLEAYGVPVVTDRGEGYFETMEVDTFLELLRAVVNLRRDVPLAAAMCSAVFGFDLSELAEIRQDHREGFFYSAFLAYAEGGADEALREKSAAMTGRLAQWRDEARFMRLDDFLWKLMRESGFYDYVSGLPRSAQRQANLRALLDRAADFQSGRVAGLRGFLTFLDRIKLRGGAEQASVLADGEDVCRIMTIHKSKGREFPVVIVAGLSMPFSQGGSNDDSLLLHRDSGVSLNWVDPAAHTYKKTFFHSALKLRQEVDERAETIRLLYVAMTRAMDTLHLIGTMTDPEKWMELYSMKEASPEVDTDIFGAANYLQLILPTAMKSGGAIHTKAVGAGDFPDGRKERSPGIAGPPASKLEPPGAPFKEPFVYPYADSAKLKSKYSVTELGRAGSETPVFFMAGGAGESSEDAGLTAAEKGTAMHRALEALDFREAYDRRGDRAWFEAFVKGLVESRVLSESEAEATEAEALQRFAGSDLLKRAAASDFLMKEAPFNMKTPYGETVRGRDEEGGKNEEIVVQGVIDCLFAEGDGLVVVDYKTGWFDVSAYGSEAERVRSVYGEQLRLYRRAAELIFEKRVSGCCIYMTGAGVTIEI